MKAGPGRRKGVPNRVTTLLKEAALLAAEQVGEDGQGRDGLIGFLRRQALENPGPFLALLGKILPFKITGDGGGAVQAVHRIEIVAGGAIR